MNRQVKKKLEEIKSKMGYVTMQTGPRCDACQPDQQGQFGEANEKGQEARTLQSTT